MSSRASSSSMGMSHLNTGFDNDLDPLFELDHNLSTAPSPALGRVTPSLSQQPSFSSSSSSFASSQPQTFFAGPSFQYDAYKQQTGLPVGGLANTFAVNRASGLQYSSNTGFVMPAETLNVPLSSLDDFDFNQTPSLDMNDMDFDAESPSDLPPMFYPSHGHDLNMPTPLTSQDDSPTYAAPIQRMYPGMHSQQAAQAKAQQAQKQEEMLRQQQAQQQRALADQRPLPSSSSKAPQQKDPMVEESISRLLNQMRHNSVASSMEEEGSTPTNSMMHGSRMRKDEDDMDEDERLLASEEGKKLSSKERRQLRNKVSARAFRSRRKEYIGQLEGELNSRTEEINDLKVQNRQLMEENTRLTDLTRMLLSSPSFSGFLNELSTSGLPAPTIVAPVQSNTTSASRTTRKDVNPHQAVQQTQGQQPRVNMALVPDSATDFSNLNTPYESWNSGFSSDFQVYSVTELPEGPSIEALSGKTGSVLPLPDTTAAKVTATIQPHPTTQSTINHATSPVCTVDPNVVLDEEAFSLYFDATVTNHLSPTVLPDELATFPLSHKPSFYCLITRDHRRNTDSAHQLERLCMSLDTSYERIARYLD